MQDKPKYAIKIVARRTGLSSHAIRIWEKRYAAVSPERTPTNRRLYSEADVERLFLLHKATLAGHAIGQVAQLSTENLKTLLGVKEATGAPPQTSAGLDTDESPTQVLFDACLNAEMLLDSEALKRALENAEVALSKPMLIEQLIVPLMHKIGDLWRDGVLRVNHEHMATAVVRSFLGNIRAAYETPPTAPGIVITTPIGQLHELGALMAAATASSEGWLVTYLGPNLPAEEIAAAAKQNQAKAIGLSIVYPGDDARMSEEMQKLRRGVSEEVVIMVGGRSALSYQHIFATAGVVHLNDMLSLSAALESLQARQPLSPNNLPPKAPLRNGRTLKRPKN
jgi:methanogenic corrinoid protein MtbC1